MTESDSALWELVRAIIEGNTTGVSRLLAASPPLASAGFHMGAARQTARKYYLDQIGRYVFAGDKALRIAAATYETDVVRLTGQSFLTFSVLRCS